MRFSAETKADPNSRQAGVEAALRRASAQARELAERTQTPIYVLRQGQIVDLRSETAKAR